MGNGGADLGVLASLLIEARLGGEGVKKRWQDFKNHIRLVCERTFCFPNLGSEGTIGPHRAGNPPDASPPHHPHHFDHLESNANSHSLHE